MKKLERKESLEGILKTNDIVLIDFYADWCGPCVMLKPILKKVAEETKNVLFLAIDVEEHQELARTFNVTSIPLLVVYKGGVEVARKTGFQTHDQIISLLNTDK